MTKYQVLDGSIVKCPLIRFVSDSQSMFTLGQQILQLGGDMENFHWCEYTRY
ncbi:MULTISPECIES: hypothetical protein [Commensalibacter]|uniref:hypothetical protein n=1 Tax=Commensalibacter TaxID=1079922 RepID=UPI0012D90C9D|nr:MULTISPECIES: hypothetical protein [Commensalibacter]MBH9969957.1 hypothetical protein [Commensalibacter sp. M0265]MBH9977147.1 hypothetical protein [Commensalibacter sp. M0266]MBH9992992.1 hypothetical protein [Commensalibacter sp. M0270]MBI0046323.1 hypothetical protein [Commensalibacter sp. M0267]MBI0056157.1 hypothetical protein [Commensalibacter sp. M0268]